ncbi:hypothetical protein [Geodermatophilus normandii]|uniref:hypothetical protein n=1 Tax=Geodermatophilus normandii TaxID=1137989 RepID=UPI0019547A80|nr:hypothetical protein [Geodermatophilus normandii]
MSMWEAMTPNSYRPDDEIAAADPGAGAPPPAEGFGVGGEEPDRPEQTGGSPAGADGSPAGADGSPAGADGSPAGADGQDTAFRTPDPADVRREPGA